MQFLAESTKTKQIHTNSELKVLFSQNQTHNDSELKTLVILHIKLKPNWTSQKAIPHTTRK